MGQSKDHESKRSPRKPALTRAGGKRIVAEVPGSVHRQVRMRCFEREILMRDYILELLAKDGIV
jgi:hypothetical protein